VDRTDWRGSTTADKLLVEKITSIPIGIEDQTEFPECPEPAWAKAPLGKIAKYETPKVTILQWLGHALRQMLVRIPYNKISSHFGFTCTTCRKRGNPLMWSRRPVVKGGDGTSNLSWPAMMTQALPDRCRVCNTKHARYKRARKAMLKIFHFLAGNQVCWFITLTRENRIYKAGDVVDLDQDKEQWVADFKRFRNRKIWKDTFPGGYWFYEYTVHHPGEKIFNKKGNWIRECKNFELNGHLHILAIGPKHIPMKQLATSWDGRIDMRRKDERTGLPLTEDIVLRYLRGYLTKTDMPGTVNIRPFGHMVKSINENT